MATKKEVTAVTPNNVFKIGNLHYELRTLNTTQRFVKTQIKSILLRNNLDLKTTMITLPSGRKVTYKELNNIKEFVKLLFPEVYVIPDHEEGLERLKEVMLIIAQQSSKMVVNWNDIGNNKVSYGSELFKIAIENLVDYEKIKEEEILDWQGKLTQTVNHKGVYPRAVQEDFPIWVATGGNAESTVKIAQKGLPIAYAIIGGKYENFKGLIEYYRKIGIASGHSEKQLKVASHSWGFVAETDEEAIQKYFHPTKQVVDIISKDRPFWQPLTFEQYLSSVSPEGAMLVGSPETVANKLIKMIDVLELDRFMLHLPLGSMQHEDILKAIELFGCEVAPKVRAYFENK